MRDVARRAAWCGVGLMIGAASATVELLFTVLSGLTLLPVLAWPRGRQAVLRPVFAGARRLTQFERQRLGTWLSVPVSPVYEDARALRYIACRWALGALGAIVLLSVALGLSYSTYWMFAWIVDSVEHPWAVILSSFGGLFLLFLAVQGVFGVAELERQLARHFLGPSHQEALERRIVELAASRAAVVDAVDDERRRIERDLHDGVQQRLVALGMLLGRALRSQDPERADRLLRQAHDESGQALADLREVAWRIYPTTLDEAGLRAALETVAERSPVPVRVVYELGAEPGKAAATAAYFVVCEAVTNAVKHATASRITVHLWASGDELCIRIEDDGSGGANPMGSGLFGLARRVDALDGRFTVLSPAGGPTVISAELPCA